MKMPSNSNGMGWVGGVLDGSCVVVTTLPEFGNSVVAGGTTLSAFIVGDAVVAGGGTTLLEFDGNSGVAVVVGCAISGGLGETMGGGVATLVGCSVVGEGCCIGGECCIVANNERSESIVAA